MAGSPTGLAVSPFGAGHERAGRAERVGWLDDYELSLIAAGLSEKTRTVYLQSARAYIADVDPVTAAPRDVERYLVGLGVGRNSLAQYQVRLKRFHAFLVREGVRVSNPLDALDRPKIRRGTPRPMPDEWVHAIWRVATPRERAWIALGLYCGLRAGEAVSIAAEDIEGDELVIRGKGDRIRRVPMRREVFDALFVADVPTSGRLFPGVGEKAASVAIGSLLRQVGAPDRFSFHALRHRAGTEWYRASRDVKVVAELLGHSSIQTTLVYAEMDLDHARWVAGQVPAIVGGRRDDHVREEVEGAGPRLVPRGTATDVGRLPA